MPSNKKIPALILLLIFSGLVYSKAFTSGYLNWDDARFIFENPMMNLNLWKAIPRFFTTYFEGDYLPIPLLTFWLELHGLGPNPKVQHAVNWLLHLANITLLSIWLRQFKLTFFLSSIILVLFALHPLQVESVLWISERKGLLSATFLFLGLICLDEAHKKKTWLIPYTLSFGFSCLCKTTGIFLPLLILTERVWLQKRTLASAIREQSGALILMVIFSLNRMAAYRTFYPEIASIASTPERIFTIPFTALSALGHYAASFLVPIHLSVLYPDIPRYENIGILFCLGILVLCFVAWQMTQRDSRAYFALWFCTLIAPVINIFPRPNFVNDRYLYLPIIGVAFCVGTVLQKEIPAFKLKEKTLQGSVVFLALILGCLSFQRSQVWQNNFTLWNDVLSKDPRQQIAWVNLGVAYYREGKKRESLSIFRKSLDLSYNLDSFYNTQLATIHRNLAYLYADTELQETYNLDLALEQARAALEKYQFPQDELQLRVLLVTILQKHRKHSEAFEEYKKVQELSGKVQ